MSMRGVFIAASITALWGFTACDSAQVPTDSGAPTVTTAACEGEPGKSDPGEGDDGHHDHGRHHGAVAVAVACLQNCAHKVEQLAEIADHHKPKHGEKKADKVAEKQEKCAELFADLTPQQQQEVQELAGDAYTVCLGPDPCTESCDALAAALNTACEPLNMPALCALVASSGPTCSEAVCPIDAATCADGCSAYSLQLQEACQVAVPDFALCPFLGPILESSCVDQICPAPPPTCEESCAAELEPGVQECAATGDPACFQSLEATAISCYGGCCVGHCDAQLADWLAGCAPDDPQCAAAGEDMHAQCVAGCAYAPSTCGDLMCEWYEPLYCSGDCEPQPDCWEGCWVDYDQDWRNCETSTDPEACWQQVEFDRQLCEWECCDAGCAPGEECCGPPPTPPVCGDGICQNELYSCPEDCPVELCYSSCDTAYMEAEQLCWSLANPWACIQEAQGELMLCQFGCCELSCGEPGCCGEPPPQPVCGDGICEGFEPEFCAEDCAVEMCPSECWRAFDEAMQLCQAEPDPQACLYDAEYQRMLCEHGCCELGCGEPGCCGPPPPPPTFCGDGVCDPGEQGWCEDCGPLTCGDGVCDPGEEGWCGDCPVCGDGVCTPDEEGWCPDCMDLCGNGVCDPGEEGWCPDCMDLCGNGVCDPGEEGWCPDCGPFCGDGVCDPDEMGWCADCPVDGCGDGVCTADEVGWCPDCGECGNGICEPGEEGVCPDCEAVCGNGICEPGEEDWCTDCTPGACGDGSCTADEVGWCADDCDTGVCGDRFCAPDEADWCADCNPELCGNGVCDPGEAGWCTECESTKCGDAICDPGEELVCPGDCEVPASCGNGLCDPGEAGVCPDCEGPCGDGLCEPGEDFWCSSDCEGTCGNGVCDPGEAGWCAECP